MIVHLAGLSHVGESWKRPGDYLRVNFEGTLNLLSAARGRRLIFASSAEVYGAVPAAGEFDFDPAILERLERLRVGRGEVLEVRPGFVGAYRGDLDDAANRLRRWLMRYCVPEVLRQDPSYPKVQWNAFSATGKTPMSWDPVEAKFYPLIDDIAPLGFEEVMIDVGWWQGGEPDADFRAGGVDSGHGRYAAESAIIRRSRRR